MKHLLLSVPALALVAVPLAAPAAHADTKTTPFPLVCDNGTTYSALINGNGVWRSAHDTASRTVLVPTSFGPQSWTLTDADGNVLDSGTDPALVKGAAEKPRGTATTCSFEITQTFTDPALGELTYAITGDVTAFTTPA